MRSLLLIKSGCKEVSDLTDIEYTYLKNLATATGPDHLVKAIRLFANAKIDNYYTLPVELALVEATSNLQTPTPGTQKADSQRPSASPGMKTKSKQFVQQPQPTTAAPAENSVINTLEDGSIRPKTITEQAPAKDDYKADTQISKKDNTPLDALDTCSEYELLLKNWNQMLEQAPEILKQSPSLDISAPDFEARMCSDAQFS